MKNKSHPDVLLLENHRLVAVIHHTTPYNLCYKSQTLPEPVSKHATKSHLHAADLPEPASNLVTLKVRAWSCTVQPKVFVTVAIIKPTQIPMTYLSNVPRRDVPDVKNSFEGVTYVLVDILAKNRMKD